MSDVPATEPDRWEPWRVWFSQHFYTTLQGMKVSTWSRHLWRNRFWIEPTFFARSMLITVSSPFCSFFSFADNRKFGDEIADTKIEPPLILLGHWRSGTTLLQRYVAMDDRFSFPTFYQCLFPGGFLHSEESNSKRWADMLPKTRIFDNMENSFSAPAEDEFALCSMTGFSPYMAWSFPKNWDYYYRYLTMKNVPEWEVAEWKKAIRFFVQKVQYKTGKRVVLKSPPHTCRIKLLQEVFPGAKFVHIHRNPFDVFPSTKKMLVTFLRNTQLQSFDPDRLDERIIEVYREMYDTFFAERDSIPKGDFHEIGYEELEASPVEEMRRLYENLSLPDFEHIREPLQKHADSLTGYQKNKFRELPEAITSRIVREWKPSLQEWGYQQSTTSAKTSV